MTMRKSLPLVGLSLAALLGACATQQDARSMSNNASHSDRHKIAVMQSSEQLEIPVVSDDGVLSAPIQSSVRSFAREYANGGHGAMVLSTPSGSDSADAAARLAQVVRSHLAASGVPFAAIAGSTYDSGGNTAAPIILSFTRFNAQAPECAPLWKQDLSNVGANGPWDSFGCSVQANLASMIADPADLLGPREEEARDAARRAVVLEAYRKGTQTHAARSSDERVTVSNAVQ